MKPTIKITDQLLAAERADAPLIAINTPDPASTIRVIQKIWATKPIAQWDIINGVQPLNGLATSAVNVINSLPDGSVNAAVATSNPIEALMKIKALGQNAIVFFHNAHLFIDKMVPGNLAPPVIQAIWNLRDLFKKMKSQLIMLAPNFTIPDELQHDILLIDEPLPTENELASHITKAFVACGLKAPSKHTLPSLLDATSGLAPFAIDQVIKMSVQKTRTGKSKIDTEALWEKKIVKIESQAGLRIHRAGPRFSDIGGNENIKDLLFKIAKSETRPRLVVFIDEIEKAMAAAGTDTSGVTTDQLKVLLTEMQNNDWTGLICYGFPGCLSGDTEIIYKRGHRPCGRPIKLIDLYHKFNGIKNATTRRRDLTYPTFLHSLTDDEIMFYNRIVAVLESGIKPLVKVTYNDGTMLRATPDHPILTRSGFVEAGNLAEGQIVIARGKMQARSAGGKDLTARPPRIIKNVKYYPLGSLHETGGYYYKRVARARLIVEAQLNNLEYDEFLHALNNNEGLSSAFRYLPADFDVHHLDGNTLNDNIENLMALPAVEHARLHGQTKNFHVEYTKEIHVISVISDGEEMTYDIQMSEPARNFCANGIVVHNTGKSELSKAFGHEANAITVEADLGAMKHIWVGSSEARMRNFIKIIKAMGGSRVFFMATCNHVAILRPELKRRFKKGIFFSDLPLPKERDVIWNLYFKKFNMHNQEKPNDDGWTGAEIRVCCETARELKISLTEACKFMTIVSKAMGTEGVRKMRQEASGKYISTQHPGVYTYNEQQKWEGI